MLLVETGVIGISEDLTLSKSNCESLEWGLYDIYLSREDCEIRETASLPVYDVPSTLLTGLEWLGVFVDLDIRVEEASWRGVTLLYSKMCSEPAAFSKK
ncbi:hypothetical protein Tco_0296828 [Tanacetum coccineum]